MGMHRRCVSYVFGVFANCAFTMPRAVFDTQAKYFVHSGLATLSNTNPTAGSFLCTVVAFRAFIVFLQTLHLPCPGLFLKHRSNTSCILGCEPDPTIIRPRAIFDAQAWHLRVVMHLFFLTPIHIDSFRTRLVLRCKNEKCASRDFADTRGIRKQKSIKHYYALCLCGCA